MPKYDNETSSVIIINCMTYKLSQFNLTQKENRTNILFGC
jgi:hypothetical protein